MDTTVGPGQPVGRRAMKQKWRELLFLHWAVAPEAIRGMLPPGLELDTFEGRAYVGLVPFTMTGIRPIWAPAVPWLSSFHEINVRTYVYPAGGRQSVSARNGTSPGVFFFSLDAANPVAVRVARAWYRLPYYYARMSLQIQQGRGTTSGGDPPAARPSGPSTPELQDLPLNAESPALPVTEYTSERLWPGPLPATFSARYTPGGLAAPAAPGSLGHFLVERYFLYTSARGHLYRGRVAHTPYPVQPVAVHALEENLVAASGITRPDEAPLAHYARGVDVDVYPLVRMGIAGVGGGE